MPLSTKHTAYVTLCNRDTTEYTLLLTQTYLHTYSVKKFFVYTGDIERFGESSMCMSNSNFHSQSRWSYGVTTNSRNVCQSGLDLGNDCGRGFYSISTFSQRAHISVPTRSNAILYNLFPQFPSVRIKHLYLSIVVRTVPFLCPKLSICGRKTAGNCRSKENKSSLEPSVKMTLCVALEKSNTSETLIPQTNCRSSSQSSS